MTALIKNIIFCFLSIIGLALGMTFYFDYGKWWGLIIMAFNIPWLLMYMFRVINLIDSESDK
jgi:Mn2+/Fe2+ NRAMP family transporter